MPSFAAAPTATTQASAAPLSPAQRLLRGVAATLAVAAAAHISFPLPFTPVPFTLQPLAVLLVGLFLGPLDGALAMAGYLLEGAAGLPVFSPAGPGGLVQLLGPTGGYLLAYPAVAWMSGSAVRRFASLRLRPFAAALFACTLATLLLFAAGACWLAMLVHLAPRAAFLAGVAPFLPGEGVKVVVAAGLYQTFAARRAL